MFELFSSSPSQVGEGRNCPKTMLKVVSEGSDYPGKIATALASASDGIIGSLLSKHKQSQCSAQEKLYLNTQQPPRKMTPKLLNSRSGAQNLPSDFG